MAERRQKRDLRALGDVGTEVGRVMPKKVIGWLSGVLGSL